MKPEWKPFVEYGPDGYTPMTMRKRWWGWEKRYVQWWGLAHDYTFYVSPGIATACKYKSDAEDRAKSAAAQRNDKEARARREQFEVDK